MIEGSGTATQAWGREPEMFGPRHEHRLAMILRETEAFPANARVLDGAVGLGQLGARMRARGARAFGIDFSFDAAHYATSVAGVPSIVGDMARLPFRDATFDGVTSGETLEHLERDGDAAAEIARVLRPGGTAVVTVPALPALWSKSDEFQDHKRRYARSALRRLFDGRLTIAKATYWGFPVVFAYDFLFILPLNISRARGRTSSPLPVRGANGERGRGRGETGRLRVQRARLLTSVRFAGKTRFLVNAVRALFAIDALFQWIPFGPGLLLVARKERQ